MSNFLHLLRFPLPPPQLNRASPWTTQTTTTSTPLRFSFSKKENPSKVRSQGRGFGVTTIPGNKEKPQGNINNSSNEEEDDDEEIPEVLFNRMLGRIVFFVGAPMASGIGLVYLLSLVKVQGIWDFPQWLPFLAILISFGTSAFGIAYGTLSTSWDPEKEGSLLGWEQAEKNWPGLWKEEKDEKK